MKAFLKILVVEILGLHNCVEPISQLIWTRNSHKMFKILFLPQMNNFSLLEPASYTVTLRAGSLFPIKIRNSSNKITSH